MTVCKPVCPSTARELVLPHACITGVPGQRRLFPQHSTCHSRSQRRRGRAYDYVRMSAAKSAAILGAAVAGAPCLATSARLAAAQAALDLQERGWTCIEDILSPEECTQYVDSVWDWLESLGTGINR